MTAPFYVLVVMDNIEPELHGPYPTWKVRDEHAKRLKEERGYEHGVFWLDTPPTGLAETGSYASAFFNDDEDDEEEET